ncbi:MAG: hypothetical protein HY301_13475 [Verrucomicrobia bacterium]|nr:hypothetical protein [Verrucomicrobiota bacterium]
MAVNNSVAKIMNADSYLPIVAPIPKASDANRRNLGLASLLVCAAVLTNGLAADAPDKKNGTTPAGKAANNSPASKTTTPVNPVQTGPHSSTPATGHNNPSVSAGGSPSGQKTSSRPATTYPPQTGGGTSYPAPNARPSGSGQSKFTSQVSGSAPKTVSTGSASSVSTGGTHSTVSGAHSTSATASHPSGGGSSKTSSQTFPRTSKPPTTSYTGTTTPGGLKGSTTPAVVLTTAKPDFVAAGSTKPYQIPGDSTKNPNSGAAARLNSIVQSPRGASISDGPSRHSPGSDLSANYPQQLRDYRTGGVVFKPAPPDNRMAMTTPATLETSKSAPVTKPSFDLFPKTEPPKLNHPLLDKDGYPIIFIEGKAMPYKRAAVYDSKDKTSLEFLNIEAKLTDAQRETRALRVELASDFITHVRNRQFVATAFADHQLGHDQGAFDFSNKGLSDPQKIEEGKALAEYLGQTTRKNTRVVVETFPTDHAPGETAIEHHTFNSYYDPQTASVKVTEVRRRFVKTIRADHSVSYTGVPDDSYFQANAAAIFEATSGPNTHVQDNH